MSHPLNKRERVLIGVRKGTRRADGYWKSCLKLEWLQRHRYLRRDTTKLCSCVMCGNPRKWNNEKTLQEKRFETS
jgi:hypothetical protein